MTDMHDEDLLQLPEALVASLARLRHRYGNVRPPAPGPALAGFTGLGLRHDEGELPVTVASEADAAATQTVGLSSQRTSPTRRRRRAKSVIAILIGTTTGKLVLGTTVAAASAGIGQWSGVVDIPGLPDRRAAVAPPVAEDDTGAHESTDDTPATTEVLRPADVPAEAGDPTPEDAEPTGTDKSNDESTDESKDSSDSDLNHDVSTDNRSETTDSSTDSSTNASGSDSSTDESKDAYGSGLSHDVSTDEHSESTDSTTDSSTHADASTDASGSDLSHDVSTDDN